MSSPFAPPPPAFLSPQTERRYDDDEPDRSGRGGGGGSGRKRDKESKERRRERKEAKRRQQAERDAQHERSQQREQQQHYPETRSRGDPLAGFQNTLTDLDSSTRSDGSGSLNNSGSMRAGDPLAGFAEFEQSASLDDSFSTREGGTPSRRGRGSSRSEGRSSRKKDRQDREPGSGERSHRRDGESKEERDERKRLKRERRAAKEKKRARAAKKEQSSGGKPPSGKGGSSAGGGDENYEDDDFNDDDQFVDLSGSESGNMDFQAEDKAAGSDRSPRGGSASEGGGSAQPPPPPVLNAQARPTSASSRPTSARPLSASTRPSSATSSSRPSSASSVRSSARPTSARPGSRPTSARPGSRPSSAASTRPGSARPGSAARSRPSSAASARPGSADARQARLLDAERVKQELEMWEQEQGDGKGSDLRALDKVKEELEMWEKDVTISDQPDSSPSKKAHSPSHVTIQDGAEIGGSGGDDDGFRDVNGMNEDVQVRRVFVEDGRSDEPQPLGFVSLNMNECVGTLDDVRHQVQFLDSAPARYTFMYDGMPVGKAQEGQLQAAFCDELILRPDPNGPGVDDDEGESMDRSMDAGKTSESRDVDGTPTRGQSGAVPQRAMSESPKRSTSEPTERELLMGGGGRSPSGVNVAHGGGGSAERGGGARTASGSGVDRGDRGGGSSGVQPLSARSENQLDTEPGDFFSQRKSTRTATFATPSPDAENIPRERGRTGAERSGASRAGVSRCGFPI